MLVYIILDGIGDVKAAFAFDITGRATLSEGDAVHHVVGFGIDQFQLDVFLFASHHLTRTEVIHVDGAEQRFLVGGSEGAETFQVVMQLPRDVLEVNLCIDIEDGLNLLRLDVLLYIFLETAAELWNIFPK